MYRFKGKMMDLDELRRALRNMTDSELLQFQEATIKLFHANGKKPGLPESVLIPLEEARADWRRRKS